MRPESSKDFRQTLVLIVMAQLRAVWLFEVMGVCRRQVCLFLSFNTKASEKFHRGTVAYTGKFRLGKTWGENITVVTAETLIDMSCGIESAGPVSGVPGRPSRSEQVTFDFFFNILIVANRS